MLTHTQRCLCAHYINTTNTNMLAAVYMNCAISCSLASVCVRATSEATKTPSYKHHTSAASYAICEMIVTVSTSTKTITITNPCLCCLAVLVLLTMSELLLQLRAVNVVACPQFTYHRIHQFFCSVFSKACELNINMLLHVAQQKKKTTD